MNSDPYTNLEPGIPSLVRGIVQDGQDLLKQQVELLRSEVKEELGKLRTGAKSVAIGAAVAGVGALFLLATLVHLLHAYAQLPLWACYGIVGGALALVGGGVLISGKKSVSDVQLTPPPQSAQALKENLEWVTKRRTPETIP